MHPSMRSILRGFENGHLQDGSDVKIVSSKVAELAEWMCTALPSSSEVVAGLRKLMEAKDCFVRQAAWTANDADQEYAGEPPIANQNGDTMYGEQKA